MRTRARRELLLLREFLVKLRTELQEVAQRTPKDASPAVPELATREVGNPSLGWLTSAEGILQMQRLEEDAPKVEPLHPHKGQKRLRPAHLG